MGAGARAQEPPRPTGGEQAPVPKSGQQVPVAQTGTLITGSYQATGNVSALGRPAPSQGQRFNLSHAPRFGGSFDARIEYYTDGSFNADSPGQLIRNINEPKFELQVTYNRPVAGGLGVTGGLLHHENFRFTDHYFWAIAGLTYTVGLGQDITLSTAALGEKKLTGVRAFYDLSGTLEWRFVPGWNTQVAYHRYENVGQSDPEPTQKEEYEFGLNRAIGNKQTVGVSFFRHIQFGAPNDQFSFVKLKYGVGF